MGVDDSETAFAAAKAAAQLAARTGAVLHVLTAYRDDGVDDIGVEGDFWTVTAEQAANDLARRVAAELDLPAERLVIGAQKGRPAQVLLDEAERIDAEVIVVGNRRVQGMSRVLGSVAGAVAHGAPCDVYIVKTT